ncbi:hypothetical protein NitYY0826_C1826 [Nitratiruptor sp. YY08-26]|uniref:TPM domain-containing protein n=1 Tax=unclassified Nitratiruptor TaxID=2624044 RepID=UPI0019150A56|nr:MULTISPECIES: TPM domain-containing protein [unclassified Nitratiruptor]BCD62938.1 hypothetical protein NitYY0813_C1824 [Nitratiruptor sp. YY08-13]BCD66873.1 hypothetical protein NitYY0826_C1826 [Nitratiruptor sp. YY08-26]
MFGAAENFIILNENILPKKTIEKINAIGNELYQKTGVGVYVAVVKKMPTKKIVDFERELSKKLPKTYVLLTLSVSDKKVDIISSQDLQKSFDKEEILSPLPWKGSIIPLLTAHFKNQNAAIEAAILNGYSEIAEQIAKHKNVNLKEAIGNTNRNIYYWLRILFYSIMALIVLNFIYRRYIKG